MTASFPPWRSPPCACTQSTAWLPLPRTSTRYEATAEERWQTPPASGRARRRRRKVAQVCAVTGSMRKMTSLVRKERREARKGSGVKQKRTIHQLFPLLCITFARHTRRAARGPAHFIKDNDDSDTTLSNTRFRRQNVLFKRLG